MLEERHRINSFHTGALIGMAIFSDVFQLLIMWIPFGPAVFSIFIRFIFWVWMKVLGVGFSDNVKRYSVNIIVSVIEVIPILNDISPSWTVGTILIVRQVHREDKRYNKKLQARQTTERASAAAQRKTHFPNGTPRENAA